MLVWILFGIALAVFLISFFMDSRAFRNVFFLLWCMLMLIAAVSTMSGSFLQTLVVFIVVCAAAALLIMPAVFIWAGILTIRHEGFSLAHSLSILFALVLWGSFAVILFGLTVRNLSTICTSLIALLLAALCYILATFMGFLVYSELCLLLPKNRKCDFVIIHGAGLLRGSEVSPLLAARLDKGIDVCRKSGAGTKIIVSGGQGGDEKVTEASAMAGYLLARGIPAEDIIPEDRSATTWQNIRFSKEIIDARKPGARVIFVTNNYHVFRTGYYAHKQHLKATGVGCRTALYYWPNAFIREYIAIIRREKLVPILILIAWAIAAAVSMMQM
jgi:uncharacterized SAM-binding protein YcdF (DUF218 family)